MDRRAFCRRIACLSVAGASGWLAEESDPASANAADDAGATDDSEPVPKPDDARRRVELLQVAEIPDDVPLSASLDVRWPWITTDRTAALELEMTNEGSSTVETHPLYTQGASSTAGEPGILVAETTRVQQSDPPSIDGECWDDPAPSAPSPEFTTENPPTLELAPEESGSVALVVYDDPSVEGCFPTGEYRFERPSPLARMDFRWGFTLRVSDVTE